MKDCLVDDVVDAMLEMGYDIVEVIKAGIYLENLLNGGVLNEKM